MGRDHRILAQEFSCPHQGNRRFLSDGRNDSDSQSTLLYVINSVSRIALRVGDLAFHETDDLSAQACYRQKCLGIESNIPICWEQLGH